MDRCRHVFASTTPPTNEDLFKDAPGSAKTISNGSCGCKYRMYLLTKIGPSEHTSVPIETALLHSFLPSFLGGGCFYFTRNSSERVERPSENRSSIHTVMGPVTEVRVIAWMDWHQHQHQHHHGARHLQWQSEYCTVTLLSLLVPGTDCQGVNHVLCNTVHTLYLIVMIHACPSCPELYRDWYWDAKNTPLSLRLYPHFAQWERLSLFLFPSLPLHLNLVKHGWILGPS